MRAEAIVQSTHADNGIVCVDTHQLVPSVARDPIHHPISIKNMAASASTRMTKKIDCTTAEVVRSPTDWALPATLKPSRQPMSAINPANSGALDKPSHRCLTGTS